MNNVTLQPYRNIDIQIFVLDYKFNILDEISGIVESASFNIDADSDIRRTANITMLLNSNYTNTGILNDVYFQSGNGYWFDKYLKIQIGIQDISNGEYQWFKQGIYLINEPSISYDAVTNSVSFQAVDLMSKMTGLRNGYLEGQSYAINIVDADGNPTNATITESMTSILRLQDFNKFILFVPEANLIPEDIMISAGGTSYDLMSQLRDINTNWEIFFDIDGTFYFQKIPSGAVELTDGSTFYDEHPTAVIDDTIWDKLLISYTLDTNFENIKNYIEVYGKTYDSENLNVATSVTVSNNTANVVVDYDLTSLGYHDTPIEIIVDGENVKLSNSITSIIVSDNNGHSTTINCNPHIKYNNTIYLIRTHCSDNTIIGEYIGYFQPQAVAWENNPQSPFYVGDVVNVFPENYNSNRYYSINDRVLFEDSIYICLVNQTQYNNPTTNDWRLDTTFNPVFKRWSATTTYTIDDIVYYNEALWMCVQSHSTPQIPNDKLEDYWVKMNSIDAVYGQFPLFEKMVREVCVGDSYDNTPTNQSAIESAHYELYSKCRLHDTISITCVPIYDLDVNKIISITLPNEGVPSYWLTKSISTTFEPNGTQSIKAMRYYPEYPVFGKE